MQLVDVARMRLRLVAEYLDDVPFVLSRAWSDVWGTDWLVACIDEAIATQTPWSVVARTDRDRRGWIVPAAAPREAVDLIVAWASLWQRSVVVAPVVSGDATRTLAIAAVVRGMRAARKASQ